MSKAAVATNLHQTANVAVHFSSKISLYLEIFIQNFADSTDFDFGKVFHLRAGINPGLFHQFVDVVLADAVKDRQCVEHRFVAREVDTCNSCHALNLFLTFVANLALALLVLRHLANHPNNSVALDDFALIANFFDAGPNFHINFACLLRLYYRDAVLALPNPAASAV